LGKVGEGGFGVGFCRPGLLIQKVGGGRGKGNGRGRGAKRRDGGKKENVGKRDEGMGFFVLGKALMSMEGENGGLVVGER